LKNKAFVLFEEVLKQQMKFKINLKRKAC